MRSLLLLEGQISTIQGRLIFWKDGLTFDMIFASVYSRMLEIARAGENYAQD